MLEFCKEKIILRNFNEELMTKKNSFYVNTSLQKQIH